jgi:hypothetical protein
MDVKKFFMRGEDGSCFPEVLQSKGQIPGDGALSPHQIGRCHD